METFQKIDLKIFEILNSLAGKVTVIDELALIFANDYFVPVSIGLILLFHWIGFANTEVKVSSQRHVIKAIIIMVIANAFILLLNQMLFRERPFVSNDVNLLFYMPTDSSFPSNACAGSIGLALGFYSRIWTKTFVSIFTLAALMSLSRIYVGVHYPGDILGGFIISIISYYIGNYIWCQSKSIQLRSLKLLENLNIA